MFESLFPGWSNPAVVAAIVGARFGLDAALTAVVARSAGVRSLPTLVAAAVTVSAVATTVLVLRGALGLHASRAEVLAQLGLLVLAGYVVATRGSRVAAATYAVVAAALVALVLVSIPLYGEATVAP